MVYGMYPEFEAHIMVAENEMTEMVNWLKCRTIMIFIEKGQYSFSQANCI
jgi:hypothetical protein